MAKKRGKKDSANHKTHSMLLSEKRTHLAQKRTELAHERTLMAHLRTATSFILFGIAFLGLSKINFDLFYWSGIIAIITGITFLVFAVIRSIKHAKEIKKIENFFGKLIKFRFKRSNKKFYK